MRFVALISIFVACRASPAPSANAAPATSQDALAPSHSGHHHGAQGYHMDFSEVERFARHFDSPDRDAWQKPAEVVTLLDLRPGHVVADIGAGTGYFLSYWSKAVGSQGRVLALDVEPNMVEYMKRRARQAGWDNVEARVVAPDDPGLAPGSVDRIVIVDTWHHIDDRPTYTTKLLRALRPGGSVLVVDFTLESDQGPPVQHRMPPEEVAKELASGGLRAEIDRTETLPKQYVVRGSKP
jgi:ubiquinone/menaquinone biosynthesis C-methylase UbiE